eukprot:3701761-Pleurochrysis_carterae.AAC.4
MCRVRESIPQSASILKPVPQPALAFRLVYFEALSRVRAISELKAYFFATASSGDGMLVVMECMH